MRTLVVAEQYPWPAHDGYRRRLDHIVRGLASAGSVEVIALHRQGSQPTEEPEIPGVGWSTAIPAAPERAAADWLASWVRKGIPRAVLSMDWENLRSELATRLQSGDPIDLIWFSHVHTWWPLRDLADDVAHVVDFDNLENLALRLRRRIPPRLAPDSSTVEHAKVLARWVTSRAFDVIDERRWERLQRQCSSEVARVTVCSSIDLARSGCDNAVVIGNGADRPAEVDPNRTSLRGDRPTLLFIGALDYEPNTDAMVWFVREVLDSVRAKVPDVRLRIVGRGSDTIEWVGAVEGVELIGAVDDVAPELRRADAAVVPIRVGAGTRLKVVEALANHIPLVTTTVGCEGIEVRDGSSALIEDEARGFADACVRVLTDAALRQSLADAGSELFESAYEWPKIEAQVAELARAVVNQSNEVQSED